MPDFMRILAEDEVHVWFQVMPRSMPHFDPPIGVVFNMQRFICALQLIAEYRAAFLTTSSGRMQDAADVILALFADIERARFVPGSSRHARLVMQPAVRAKLKEPIVFEPSPLF